MGGGEAGTDGVAGVAPGVGVGGWWRWARGSRARVCCRLGSRPQRAGCCCFEALLKAEGRAGPCSCAPCGGGNGTLRQPELRRLRVAPAGTGDKLFLGPGLYKAPRDPAFLLVQVLSVSCVCWPVWHVTCCKNAGLGWDTLGTGTGLLSPDATWLSAPVSPACPGALCATPAGHPPWMGLEDPGAKYPREGTHVTL